MTNPVNATAETRNGGLFSIHGDKTKIIPFLGLLVVIVFFEIVSHGALLSWGNASILLDTIFSIGLGVVGVLFLMTQGEIDFSIGAVVAFSGALSALSYQVNPALILPVALGSGLLVGLVNGVLISRFHIPSFIATLSMSFVLKGITSVLLGGTMGIPFAVNKFDTVFLKLPVLLLAMILGYIVFEYTRFGKHSKAIGSLPEAARQSGVNVAGTRLTAFIISGCVSGLVGFFTLIRTCTASPSSGAGFEFNVLIALMVGGLSMSGGWTSKFRTVVIGCLFMSILSLGMTLWGIDVFMQQLIKGIIFIVAVTISFERKNTVIK